MPKPSASAVRLALIASLFALVLGARWALIDRYGMDLPYWDQWDGEGLHLLAPHYEGHLTPAVLFQPHNEHRIVLTKLLSLGLTLANGQWDQRLEATVNAALGGALAVAIFLFGEGFLGRRWRLPLFVLAAAVCGLPFAWENIVEGFQSQFLLLIGLSFGAIAWLPAAEPWSRAWWLGSLCLLLAMVSMASGFFATAVVTGLILLRLFRREQSPGRAAPALVLAAVLLAIGCATRVTCPWHEPLKAHTVRDFAGTLAQDLEWPARTLGQSGLAIVFWAPWCWLAWRILGRGREPDRGAAEAAGPTLAGLGGWVLLQLLATAYARGDGGNPPPSRYMDTLVFGAAANALALGWLWTRGGLAGSGRRRLAVLSLLWTCGFAYGTACQLKDGLGGGLPALRTYHFYCVENVRNFLATGDEAYLRHDEIPYPGAESFLQRLDTPSLRRILPVSVRDPLPLVAADPPGPRSGGSPGPFVRWDTRRPQDPGPPPAGSIPALPPGLPPLANAVGWSSYGGPGAARTGTWESAPIRALRRSWLKFQLAGQPGAPGVSLRLRDAATRRLLAEVLPRRVPGNSWRSVCVRAPSAPFVVEARDDDSAHWLAFSRPVEMGGLSYLAWRCARNGLPCAGIAAGAALCLGLASRRIAARK